MDTMVTSVNTALTGVKKSSLSALLTVLGSLLVIVAFFMVAYQVYQAQPSQVIVNNINLSPTEYNALNESLSGYENSGFFTANLSKLQDKVMSQDWIGQVNIERRWNKGLLVTALPREPIAKFGSNHLIDAQGDVFTPIDEKELARHDLTMLQGDKHQSYIIMQQMQQVNQWFIPLNLHVKDIILTPRMTWVLLFDNDLRIIVDNENTSQKLMNVSELLQNQLSDKIDDITSIDLRYKNGFAIAWKVDEAVLTDQTQLLEQDSEENDVRVSTGE